MVLTVVAVVVAVPTAVWATHSFTDVPDGKWYSEPIAWLKTTGITKGCSTTEYCPDRALDRKEMGTFLYRLSGNDPKVPPSVNAAELEGKGADAFAPAGHGHGAFAITGSSDEWERTTDGSSLIISIGSVEVVLDAPSTVVVTFTAESDCYGGPSATAYCSVALSAREGANPREWLGPSEGFGAPDFAFDSVEAANSSQGNWESHTVTRYAELGPGTWTIVAHGASFSSQSPVPTFRLDDWTLQAVAYEK